jgi:phosphatidylglycerophosphatase C
LKTVLFDFDGTLTVRDTVHGYYRALRASRPRRAIGMASVWTQVLLSHLGANSPDAVKKAGFRAFIQGRPQEELETVGRSYVARVPLHAGVVDRLDRARAAGDRVMIVSASWQVYVRFFRPDVETVATTIDFVEGRASAMGTHLAGSAKVAALRRVGIEKVDDAYSDSLLDLPLLRLADRAWLVEHNGICRQLASAELSTAGARP